MTGESERCKFCHLPGTPANTLIQAGDAALHKGCIDLELNAAWLAVEGIKHRLYDIERLLSLVKLIRGNL